MKQTSALVTNWKYQLLNHVYDKCIEVIGLLSDSIIDTHFPYDINKRSSKLDYIWVSNNLAPLFINFEVAAPLFLNLTTMQLYFLCRHRIFFARNNMQNSNNSVFTKLNISTMIWLTITGLNSLIKLISSVMWQWDDI